MINQSKAKQQTRGKKTYPVLNKQYNILYENKKLKSNPS